MKKIRQLNVPFSWVLSVLVVVVGGEWLRLSEVEEVAGVAERGGWCGWVRKGEEKGRECFFYINKCYT